MELLVLLVVAVAGIALLIGVIGLVVAAIGLAVKAIPVLLVGYLVVRLIRRLERPRGALTASERAWLDTRA